MGSPKVLFKRMSPESHWDKVSLDDVDDVIDLKKKIKKEVSPTLDAYSVDRLILKATKTNIQEANNATELDKKNKLVNILNEFRVLYDGALIKRSFAENIILFVYVISVSINKVSDMKETPTEIRSQVIGYDYISIEFEHALGMEQLRLKRTEYDELVEKFIEVVYANESYKLTIPADVTDAIFNATARHPYLIRKSLSCLKNYFRSGHKDASDMSRYIMSSAYFFAIVGTFDSTSTFSINPGDDQMYQTAKKFKCLDLITEAIEEGCYQFVAPIEAQLTLMLVLCTEPGGYLNFYIDGFNWGVGIMRKGKMMADLIDHFDRKGKHSNIPFARWAIIDFRHKSTVPKKLESNVWYALYADDYKTITVWHQGHEDMVLILCGDSFLSPFQST
ncbi:17058_t:CDS:2 [Gigaspora margarita]|uniref:17058_t:CDS:1 n=1 Tax=Gigaspora margarita TaxID=4874 RepID=A0ABN7W4I3_GIGMA|nr:17058_t:CDS:2 [Gigaspora margarita]